jgi:hypothetical protein
MWAEYRLDRTGDHYEAIVAVDRFVDDECHWYPRYIGFQISNQENLTTGEFSPRFGHIAGPENVVGVTGPRIVGGVHEVVMPEPQTIECRQRRENGQTGLKCKHKTGDSAEIAVDAREIQVDVHDLSTTPWTPVLMRL